MNYLDVLQAIFRIFYYSLIKLTGMQPYEVLLAIMFALILIAGNMMVNIAIMLPHALSETSARLGLAMRRRMESR